MIKKTYIIAQTILVKRDMSKNNIHNYWDNIIRVVVAKDKESAIGKFVLNTSDIKAEEKLDIQCYHIDDLKTIK